MYTEPYRRQHETMALIKRLGGNYETAAAEKRLRLWYGATQNVVRVDVADCNDPNEFIVHIAGLPCLETLVVGGRRFGDEHLAHLKGLDSLRGLILDSYKL